MTFLARDSYPFGVKILPLQPRPDSRGTVTEIFRTSWESGLEPVQWNAVRSEPNVLRGMHLHSQHADYLVMLAGTMILGLKDVRPESPTAGLAGLVELRAEIPSALTIPVGVAHAFYFPVPSVLVYGVTEYWNPLDEMGCRWDDPDIGIDWPCTDPVLSERDEKAGSFKAMKDFYLEASASSVAKYGT